MRQVCSNAYQKYIKSRPGASVESVKRIKEFNIHDAGVLPEYSELSDTAEDIIAKMKNYKPQGVSMQSLSDIT